MPFQIFAVSAYRDEAIQDIAPHPQTFPNHDYFLAYPTVYNNFHCTQPLTPHVSQQSVCQESSSRNTRNGERGLTHRTDQTSLFLLIPGFNITFIENQALNIVREIAIHQSQISDSWGGLAPCKASTHSHRSQFLPCQTLSRYL